MSNSNTKSHDKAKGLTSDSRQGIRKHGLISQVLVLEGLGDFMLKVHKKKLGDVIVLCLNGQLVTGETATLREAVLSVVDGVAVVLDLARVSRIDARALGVLLELRAWTQSKGIEFRLTNVTRLVRQVVEITRLDSVFEIASRDDGRSARVHGQRVALPACV